MQCIDCCIYLYATITTTDVDLVYVEEKVFHLFTSFSGKMFFFHSVSATSSSFAWQLHFPAAIASLLFLSSFLAGSLRCTKRRKMESIFFRFFQTRLLFFTKTLFFPSVRTYVFNVRPGLLYSAKFLPKLTCSLLLLHVVVVAVVVVAVVCVGYVFGIAATATATTLAIASGSGKTSVRALCVCVPGHARERARVCVRARFQLTRFLHVKWAVKITPGFEA